MKQCPQCHEEFADKFGFCPVDGTPLDVPVAEPAQTSAAADESVVTASGSASSNGSDGPAGNTADDWDATTAAGSAFPPSNSGAEREELHLTFLEDEGLTRRLVKELKAVGHDAELTWPEFKRDPVGFTRRSATAYGSAGWKFFSQRNVAVAILAALVIIPSVIGLVIFLDSIRSKQLAGVNPYENLELVGYVESEIPKEQPTPDEGTAGTNKGTGGGSKPKPEKSGGGGGGGREEALPVSKGKPAPGMMQDQILPPSAKPPPMKNPSLPMPQTIVGDPLKLPNIPDKLPYGDPKSTSTTPSDGSGTGGGQGTGSGTGQGPGDGRGYGPGRGENVGGGDTNYGGGGPGGGGGGVDYNRPFRQNEVTRKALITFKPEPGFTEEARKNNVTGVVRLRAILSASGSVTNITTVKGLPDGLTEKAISAARQIRFTPAEKDGRNVSQYVVLEYNFNIY
ncbi:MAG: energy transducer TonB [Acidobacteria bacterium]|nr:energy transducer TonB [Acidobacteriota bacterium]